MTVSDWGSAAAPFGAPGIQQGRYGQVHAQGRTYVERPQGAQGAQGAKGGPDPRYDPQSYPPQSHAAAAPRGAGQGGGYPAPEPLVGAQARLETAVWASRQATGPGAGYGAGYGSPQAVPQRGGQAVAPAGPAALNIVGALLSLALIVGLGVWGYKLAVRDVTGVPVVKALAGPMRIQPEEPGGVVAPHQGLAVNDVAAVGTSTAPVDQLRLAPPTAELAEEDVPARPETLAGAQAGTGAQTGAATEVTRSAESPATAPLPSNGGEINADAAVAEALGLTDIPGLDAPDATATSAAPASAAPIEVIPESVPGVVRSPRPMPRPAGFAPLPEITAEIKAVDVSAAADRPAPARPGDSTAAPALNVAPGVALGQEIDPAAIDPTARLVQLGAFKSPDEARAGWQEFAALNPELFDNRNWTIERHQAGGTPFYRLRALGFDGLQDARAFCAALVAAQGTCVPVIDTASGTVTN